VLCPVVFLEPATVFASIAAQPPATPSPPPTYRHKAPRQALQQAPYQPTRNRPRLAPRGLPGSPRGRWDDPGLLAVRTQRPQPRMDRRSVIQQYSPVMQRQLGTEVDRSGCFGENLKVLERDDCGTLSNRRCVFLRFAHQRFA
jgi:hypothetical protein